MDYAAYVGTLPLIVDLVCALETPDNLSNLIEKALALVYHVRSRAEG